MASLFGLGFLRGAAATGLDRIDAREEEERYNRKAQLLERLRMDTQKELADYEDLLASGKGDKNFSGADEGRGKFINRNNKGDTISERDLTANELAELKAGRDKDSLDAEWKREQIAASKAQTAREAREAKARIAELNRRGLDGSGSEDDPNADSFSIGEELIKSSKHVTDDLLKAGVPGTEVARFAAITAANARQSVKEGKLKQDQAWAEAQRRFADGARMLKEAVRKSDEVDAEGKPTFIYDDQAGLDAINKRRTSMGLDTFQ